MQIHVHYSIKMYIYVYMYTCFEVGNKKNSYSNGNIVRERERVCVGEGGGLSLTE